MHDRDIGIRPWPESFDEADFVPRVEPAAREGAQQEVAVPEIVVDVGDERDVGHWTISAKQHAKHAQFALATVAGRANAASGRRRASRQ